MASILERFGLIRNDSKARSDRPVKTPEMLAAVATDAHFWVPTLVLIAGLILLRWLR